MANASKLRKRKESSHKGQNGRVLLVGGSIDYVGAAYLTGMAALRSGVDNVTVVAPEKVPWAVTCLSADLIPISITDDFFTSSSFTTLS